MSAGAYLDELASELLALPEPELVALLDSLDPDELEVVEIAFSRQSVEDWRTSPAAFAQHWDAAYRRWRYVELISDFMARAVDTAAGVDVERPLTRGIVMLPSRYGKTRTTSVATPGWGLDRYPHLKFVLASYGDELAMANSLEVRDTIEAHSAELRVRIRRDKRAVKMWRTSAGGQVRAVGAGAGLTGHGGDVLIVDDLFKDWQEAHSPAIRDARWNWFRTVLYLRQQTGHSAIVVVGTRWHEDDVVGRLLEGHEDVEPEAWEVLRIPALAESPEEQGAKPWEQGPDPLGRAPGEVIEPERFEKPAVLARAKQLGSYLTAGMEQQRPSSAEGGILKRKWWGFYTARPLPHEADDWLTSWDMSFADAKDSSFVVGQVWARVGSRRLLIDQVRDQMDYPTARRAVVSLGAKWPHVTRHVVESKANGPAVIADLRGHMAGLIGREPKGSKTARAHAAAGLVEGGDVLLPDPGIVDGQVDRSFVHGFVDECAAFPGGTNDDQVDAFSQGMSEWQTVEQPGQSHYRRTTGARR